MPAQVRLPGVGPVNRTALLLGGGTAVVVMGVLWWRKRHAAAASTAADPNAVDDGAGSGMAGGGGPLTGPDVPTTATPTSNPQWTALVMQQLGGVDDPTALATALGLYLTGQAVTTDQERLIDAAIAVAGYPPVSGPNGYPPAIRTQPPGGQTPPPTPAPAPAPSTAPAPAPPPNSGGGWHTVTRWPTRDSTISGLTAHYHPGLAWQTTWNHPNNAQLRAKRGRPELIRAGDRVFVP